MKDGGKTMNENFKTPMSPMYGTIPYSMPMYPPYCTNSNTRSTTCEFKPYDGRYDCWKREKTNSDKNENNNLVEYYLPVNLKLRAFYELNPNGKIKFSDIHQDPEQTAGAFVCSVTIFTDISQSFPILENFQVRRGSNAIPDIDEGISADPYNCLCIAAASHALSMIGYDLLPKNKWEKATQPQKQEPSPSENKKENIKNNTELSEQKSTLSEPELSNTEDSEKAQNNCFLSIDKTVNAMMPGDTACYKFNGVVPNAFQFVVFYLKDKDDVNQILYLYFLTSNYKICPKIAPCKIIMNKEKHLANVFSDFLGQNGITTFAAGRKIAVEKVLKKVEEINHTNLSQLTKCTTIYNSSSPEDKSKETTITEKSKQNLELITSLNEVPNVKEEIEKIRQNEKIKETMDAKWTELVFPNDPTIYDSLLDKTSREIINHLLKDSKEAENFPNDMKTIKFIFAAIKANIKNEQIKS